MPRDHAHGAWAWLLRAVLCVALPCLVSGCVAWPERATGGLAETYQSESPRLRDLERRFVEATKGRATTAAPAALMEARGYLIRAKREHAGGLLADAQASADRVEGVLEWLEARGLVAPSRPDAKVGAVARR